MLVRLVIASFLFLSSAVFAGKSVEVSCDAISLEPGTFNLKFSELPTPELGQESMEVDIYKNYEKVKIEDLQITIENSSLIDSKGDFSVWGVKLRLKSESTVLDYVLAAGGIATTIQKPVHEISKYVFCRVLISEKIDEKDRENLFHRKDFSPCVTEK